MNILMIMTDQMHKYALGKISPYVKTPNLDMLADRGTIFTEMYSNNPVCTPFRGVLYSGRYSKDCLVQYNNEALSPDEICLPNELEKLDYETSFVGKLHLGDSGNLPIPREFWAGHKRFIGYQCYNGFKDNVCFYDEQGEEHKFEEHRTDVTARIGIERMRELVRDGKPFLHTIFFQAPHYPEQPSQRFEDMYNDVKIPLPEEYAEIDPYTQTYSPPSAQPKENCPDFINYGNNIERYLKMYYAMVTQIDYNVGLIIEELEKLGIYDDTAIIFSSDHGDMQGSHGLKNKCLPYERSCGIPMIVSVPNIDQVKVCTTPVTAVDIYPTCMEIAGGKSEKNLPGKSLISLIKGEETQHPDVFAENHMIKDGWYMVRSGDIKAVFDDKTMEMTMMFDMKNDPTESFNLIGDEKYQNQVELMYKKFSQYNITKN